MIERIYLLFEICTYLIVVNDLFGKKFKMDFPAIITISLEVVIFQLTNHGALPKLFRIIPYVVLILYVYVEFSTTIKKKIINMFICIVIIGCLQMLLCPIFLIVKDESMSVLIINMLAFLVSYYLVKKGVFYKIMQFVIKYNKKILFILMNCAILFIYTMIYFKFFKEFSFFDYLLLLTVYILVLLLTCIWKKEHENVLKKDQEIDLFSKYSSAESDYIQEIRKKQHEFKNQINALYSIHYTCSSYEELVERQEKYAGMLVEENVYNDVVLSCKSPVMAGFLITKLIQARDIGLVTKYTIRVCEIQENTKEYDLIRVIGIFLDNAIEAASQNTEEEKRVIDVNLNIDSKQTSIVVENIGSYMSNTQIQNCFLEGYSTKGKDRGLGLYNVKEIKEKYNAEIIVRNIERESENWISFRFLLNY